MFVFIIICWKKYLPRERSEIFKIIKEFLNVVKKTTNKQTKKKPSQQEKQGNPSKKTMNGDTNILKIPSHS